VEVTGLECIRARRGIGVCTWRYGVPLLERAAQRLLERIRYLTYPVAYQWLTMHCSIGAGSIKLDVNLSHHINIGMGTRVCLRVGPRLFQKSQDTHRIERDSCQMGSP
jgi:hypothetical protein